MVATKTDSDHGLEPTAGAPVIADDVPARLRSAVSRLARRLKPTAAAGSLTLTEVDILVTTSRRGPLRLSELAQAASMNPTMLSRVVAKLEAQGLLGRLADPFDGRACRVEVTAAGRRLHERIRSERTDLLSRHLSQLDAEQRSAVAAALPVLEELAEALVTPPRGGAA